jgi:hypothetical protein
MKKYKISRAMRFFFLGPVIAIWTGIWLTGFSVAHWLLYVPAIFFSFAVLTGICPGLIVSNLAFGNKNPD